MCVYHNLVYLTLFYRSLNEPGRCLIWTRSTLILWDVGSVTGLTLVQIYVRLHATGTCGSCLGGHTAAISPKSRVLTSPFEDKLD